jgi:hypothetical protein
MNAYELADKLSVDVWDEATIVGSIHLGIKMLRQQADRIAELEHMNKNWQLSETMAYNRIAELEKQLNTPKTYVLDGKQVWDTTPQIKEHCDPLCKPSICNCVKEEK